MSEIPFITRLGDELERTAFRAPTRRRRRVAIFAAAGALVLSGTATAMGVFDRQAEQQATNAIDCRGSAGNTLAIGPTTSEIGMLSAVELCRRELARTGRPVDRLVACSERAIVAVIPGRTSGDCVAAGLAPLSPAYARAEARTVRLERALLRIEGSTDCIAPARLAAQVQAELDREGWTGWRAVASGPNRGPCGTISNIGGDGRRRIDSYDAPNRRILVLWSAPRHLTDLLYAAPRGLVGPLITHSGSRCFTVAKLRAYVERTFRGTGVAARVRATRHAFPPNASLVGDDGRWARYQQGCAIAVGAAPGRDGRSATIEVWLKP